MRTPSRRTCWCVPASGCRCGRAAGYTVTAGGATETLMPPGQDHAFRLWKQAGYRTGLIGKNHRFTSASDRASFDIWCEIGHGGLPFDPIHTRQHGLVSLHRGDPRCPCHTAQHAAPEVRAGYAVTDYPLEDQFHRPHHRGALEEFGNQPFALWVSYPDPHEPWEALRQYAEMFPPEKIELPPARADEFSDGTAPERNRVLYEILGMDDDSQEDIYGVLGCYYGMTRFVDDGVGQILEALDRLGLRENTIVVFCADHGDFAGEHNMTTKGGVFYDCLTHVPLIVSWPGHFAAGVRDASMVNLVDVVPTLLHHQGIPVPRSMHGELLPTVTEAAPREATFSEYGAGGPLFHMDDLAKLPKPYGRAALMRSLRWREAEGRRKMVRTPHWKYVHDPMGDLDELYDLVNDPWELTNVAADLAHAPVIAEMRGHLADWSINTEDSPPVPLPEAVYYEFE
ncbi:MAG: sulfatase-like hydrolase/transferase [Caldilineaceae bacterium]